MDIATFDRHFPEFSEVDENFKQAKLIEAQAYMGVGLPGSRWGSFGVPGALPTQTDFAQGNLAADYIVTSPLGTGFRLESAGDGDSAYRKKFEALAEAICGPFAFVPGAIPR